MSVKTLKYLYEVFLNNERHHVTKDRRCLSHGSSCPSIAEVLAYLQAGGERCLPSLDMTDEQRLSESVPAEQAEESPKMDQYWYIPPPKCPVCGHQIKVSQDRSWACEAGGTLHYWQAKANVLIALQRANPRTELYPGLTLKECDDFRKKQGKGYTWERENS